LNFEIIEFCTPETLIKREQFYLDSLNPFFNTRKIAENMTGIKRTEEQKQKISQKLKGRILSEEHKNKISKANIGKILTEETKKKLSINKIGSKNHMFGKTKELHPKYGKKYKQKKSKTPKKVIDLKTNIVYNSAKEVSEKLNIPYSTVYRNLLNYNKNKKFQYYENV
jgi:group I intron endonuclease